MQASSFLAFKEYLGNCPLGIARMEFIIVKVFIAVD